MHLATRAGAFCCILILPMPVRTATLARATVPDILTATLFTVPAGFTWVIKDILLLNLAAVANTITVQLQNPAGTVFVTVFSPTINAGVGAEYAGFVVAQAGDILTCFGSVGNYRVWVSGSKLFGVAT